MYNCTMYSFVKSSISYPKSKKEATLTAQEIAKFYNDNLIMITYSCGKVIIKYFIY